MLLTQRHWAALFIALGIACTAQAQDVKNYPNRPVRLVVPYAPGGTADTIARIVSDGLYTRLGRPVVLDTRSGANSVVGNGAGFHGVEGAAGWRRM